MKAAVYQKYGPPDVVKIKEVDTPRPGPDDVLVKIHATCVNSADWRARSLEMPAGFGLMGRLIFGIRAPKQQILGIEMAGVVTEIGKDVSRFSVGDAVFGMSGNKLGCHAEYAVFPQDAALALKPENLSFEQAAALGFGGSTALYFLRDRGDIQTGEQVLVNGASGTTGSAAVQLAKAFGAQVTGVCSTANLELVRSIGSDKVIDYTQQDFTTNGETYDIIIDSVGNATWGRAQRSLTPQGRLLMVLASLGGMLKSVFVSKKHGKKLLAGAAPEKAEDMAYLAELAKTGAFNPVIDTVFPLKDICAAHALVDSGHKKGSVVVRVVE